MGPQHIFTAIAALVKKGILAPDRTGQNNRPYALLVVSKQFSFSPYTISEYLCQTCLLHRRLLLPEKECHRECPLHSHCQPQPTSQATLFCNPTSSHRPNRQYNNEPELAVTLRIGAQRPLEQFIIEQQVTHQRRQRDGRDLRVAQPFGGEDLAGCLEGQEGDGDVLQPDGRVLIGDAADGMTLGHDGCAHEE